MSSDLYALIALAARYWFVALMVVLLFRGWRMTVADNRRAKLLRAWMGQTGCVGEWIANPGAKKRVSYPIPREGVLGSGRSADVRIRSRDLKRAHAHFELREGGLLITPLGSALLSVGEGFTGRAVFLRDGDVLTAGKLSLMLVLFDAPAEEEDEADAWFEAGPGEGPYAGDAGAWSGDYWADEPGADARYAQAPAFGAFPPDFDEFPGEAPAAKRARTGTPGEAPKSSLRAGARRKRAVPAEADARSTGGKKVVAKRARRNSAGRARARTTQDPEMWFDDAPVPRASAPRTAGRRAGSAAKDEEFNEDSIWRDL